MDKLNQQFQTLLNQHQFSMKVIEEDECYIYKGRLSISHEQLVDFAVFLSKSNDSSIAQIVFNNITYLDDDANRCQWLEAINQLNISHGLYYYFALDIDQRVFARYVTKVSNVDELFYILRKGGTIMRQAIHYLSTTTLQESEDKHE